MYKKIFKSLVPLFIISFLLVSGCKKYDDGPTISLRSKTSRLTGNWEIVNNNGGFNNVEQYIQFDENGAYQHIIQDNYGILTNEVGNWEWANDKKNLIITVDTPLEVEIKRLTNSELWFESDKVYQCEKR